MLKCDVLEIKNSGIKFEDLPLGATFVVRSGDEIQESPYEWFGMKVASAIDCEIGRASCRERV